MLFEMLIHKTYNIVESIYTLRNREPSLSLLLLERFLCGLVTDCQQSHLHDPTNKNKWLRAHVSVTIITLILLKWKEIEIKNTKNKKGTRWNKWWCSHLSREQRWILTRSAAWEVGVEALDCMSGRGHCGQRSVCSVREWRWNELEKINFVFASYPFTSFSVFFVEWTFWSLVWGYLCPYYP
jgi:hypothetical protein